jgi:hypothetical protein
MPPKFQNLMDFDWLMKLLDHCWSDVSRKEVTGKGHPSQTNDITISVVRSARYWNGDHYPITLAWFEIFEILYNFLYYTPYYVLYILVSLYTPPNYRYNNTHVVILLHSS